MQMCQKVENFMTFWYHNYVIGWVNEYTDQYHPQY